MKFRLHELLISCHEYQEVVPLSRFSYFYGRMGAGKSSIARLIDYCLGGDLELTPALQSEFVSATLSMMVEDSPLSLERSRGSNQVRAQWTVDEQSFDAIVPARTAGGEVVPGTGVYVLSDLLFHLSGRTPPKVRRSKLKEDSELERLSMRDLLWYCYLDQDTIDSEFFHLDADAELHRRLKSRDVLRFVVGFHQERVAELESQLEQVRNQRLRLEAGAEALRQALVDADLSSKVDVEVRVKQIEDERARVEGEIAAVRNEGLELRDHGMDVLREKGRALAAEVIAVQDAINDVQEVLAADRRHLNELSLLSNKFRRMTSARAVLRGVEFEACPRCARSLPDRERDACRVCGQADPVEDLTGADSEAIEKDVKARATELGEAIALREAQLASLKRTVRNLADRKAGVDAELSAASRQYDSVFLSRALTLEHEKARLEGEALMVKRLRVLPDKVAEEQEKAAELSATESSIRRELREARAEAERDTGNLRRLEELFLDCLVRSRIPGFTEHDIVQVRSPSFLPEVCNPSEEGITSTSFANLGSGGKKTLFKCCFALAMHRLAVQIGAQLPSLLVLDSPMKNISERENVEQFEGFHELLYELADGELTETQFIVVDKEFFPPPDGMVPELQSRYMTPDDPGNPPLLRGYSGH